MKEEILSRMEEERQEIVHRKKWVIWMLIISGLILTGRLWHLQIIHGEQLRDYSEINRLKPTQIPAPRGLIFDRNLNILVENLIDLELVITPQYIKDIKPLAKDIAPIIKMAPQQIINLVKQGEKKYGPFRPVVIKKHISQAQVPALKHLQWDYTGVKIQSAIIRHYPLKQNGAHVFGYLSEIDKKQIPKFNEKYGSQFRFQSGDIIGKSGLEAIWESELRGVDGLSFVEVDVHNRAPLSRIAELGRFRPKPALPGKNLILTIDKKLQEKVYASFFRKDKTGVRHGSALVMKNNGEILAWVSYPAYDPNVFSKGISSAEWTKLSQDPFKPLRNKALQDHYPPGSVFKPFVALAALQEGFITEQSLHPSPKELVFGKRTYHDYRKTGHGLINVKTAIERSANVFFYKLGINLKIDKMAHYARLFNLGQKTNIKMEGEVEGLIPDTKWKKQKMKEPWQAGENLSHAIGQGFILTTPLQIAVAYNAIATQGQVVKPFLVKQVRSHDDKEIKTFSASVSAVINENQILKKNFEIILQALKQVVHGPQGTAKWWKIKETEMAGKTGTAQVMSFSKKDIHEKCYNRPLHQRHHGWFVALAPALNPEITVVVLTERSCSGSGGSAPLARDIIRFYFQNKTQIKTDT